MKLRNINWAMVITFVAGGFAGQVLNIGYGMWSGRLQPVAYRISTDTVFSSDAHAGGFQAEAEVTHDGKKYPFKELSLVRIDMTNDGNRDIGKFPFGISLADEHRAVLCVIGGSDRSHRIGETEPRATPAEPRDAVDFICEPFNRQDQYTIKLYIANSGAIKPEQVKLSTAEPVRFYRTETVDERFARPMPPWIVGMITGMTISALAVVGALEWQRRHREGVMEHRTSDGGYFYERRGVGGEILHKLRLSKDEVTAHMKELITQKFEATSKAGERGNDVK